jgi:hypothetical protein
MPALLPIQAPLISRSVNDGVFVGMKRMDARKLSPEAQEDLRRRVV